ncbi:MAG: hypothetical protein AB8F94_18010 [Saprospiraceae bacterium]
MNRPTIFKFFLFRIVLIFFFHFLLTTSTSAQINPVDFFEEVKIKIDDNIFSTKKDTLRHQGEKHFHFEYKEIQAVAAVEIYPSELYPIRTLQLLPSKDYEVIDSIVNVNNTHFRFKVKFTQLTLSKFLQFTFSIKSDIFVNPYIDELKLLQTTSTSAFLRPTDNRLFIGEEKTFKVETNRPNNIVFSNQWTRGEKINYKFSRKQDGLWIHLLPNTPGIHRINIPVQLKIPSLEKKTKKLNYYLLPLEFRFEVKQSKLVFLSTNQKEITLKSGIQSEGIEIELDYHSSLKLKKTYRLEQQEEKGGWLIGEIFTRSVLSNGRVLCWFRPFNYHRQSEGYLYIKDGDLAKFITNFNITPPTRIDKISVVSKKGNSSKNNIVYPGETVEIKVRGEGLSKSKLIFEGLTEIQSDTLLRTENEIIFLAKIPMNINESEIKIFNWGESIGQSLQVQEYQIPHPLDFVSLKIEETPDIIFSEIDQTIFTQKTIPNIIIAFDPHKIDKPKRLFGKQMLSVEVSITSNTNQLLDRQMIPNITICPGENSPRFDYYDHQNCRFENISLNQYLRQKTFDLEAWSRIEITIQHDRTKYGGQGFYKKAEIILRRSSSFDLDVSFPAGLVTKKVGTDGFGSLSGVSMAIIAQFSFYHPRKIAKTRPFKIGAGFLALNAFNFAENASNRDVGIVLLGSLYPIQRKQRSKLSFPLYLGGGYFLSEGKFFYLLGPGIRLRI